MVVKLIIGKSILSTLATIRLLTRASAWLSLLPKIRHCSSVVCETEACMYEYKQSKTVWKRIASVVFRRRLAWNSCCTAGEGEYTVDIYPSPSTHSM